MRSQAPRGGMLVGCPRKGIPHWWGWLLPVGPFPWTKAGPITPASLGRVLDIISLVPAGSRPRKAKSKESCIGTLLVRASGPTKGILSSSQGCAESSRGFRQSNARMEAVILRILAQLGLLQDQTKVSPSSSDLATVAGDSATQGRPNEEFSGTSVGTCSPRQVCNGLQLSQRTGKNKKKVHFEPCSSPGFGVQELIFPRFPCCSAKLAFLGPPTPLWKTLESVEMVEACSAKEAGVREPMVFLWLVDATTRYDATGPRPRISAQGSQILSPERPADPRQAVLLQHRPVLLAVRQLRDFNRRP